MATVALLPNKGFPGGSVVKNPLANAGNIRDAGSVPGLGRLPWRRKWQPTPAFLPGASYGRRSLVGYSSLDHRVRRDRSELAYTCLIIWVSISEKKQLN